MCDSLTELQMAVNAWVAFATKNIVYQIEYFLPGMEWNNHGNYYIRHNYTKHYYFKAFP